MTTDSKPLRRFGDYQLFHRVGRDGPFHLFRARQTSLHRLVILKVLPERNATLEFGALLRREAEAADKLDHPGIVRVYERGDIKGSPYLALAHQEGEWLASHLRTSAMPVRRAIETARLVATALAYAHEHDVVHGSLRPEVVWVGAEGQTRLAGFGCAIHYDALDPEMVKTSAGFLAPEQAGSRGAVTPATDVYSLGALLYAMLTGSPPHQGATVEETCRLIREQPPVRPSRLQPGIPQSLDVICLKCLNTDPRKRYGSDRPFTRFIADLKRVDPAAPDGKWWEKVHAWYDRHGILVRSLALVVPLVTIPALWDRQRHRSAWTAVSQRSTSYEDQSGAARYFERELADNPLDGELRAAAMLGRFRIGRDAPAFYQTPVSLTLESDRWTAVQTLTIALHATRRRQFDKAYAILRSAREHHYVPGTEIERHLHAELLKELGSEQTLLKPRREVEN